MTAKNYKRVMTALCDFVVDYQRPAFYRTYETFTEQQLHHTCDFPMCDECTNKYNTIYDFCPHHNKFIKEIKPTKQMMESIRDYQTDCLKESFGLK